MASTIVAMREENLRLKRRIYELELKQQSSQDSSDESKVHSTEHIVPTMPQDDEHLLERFQEQAKELQTARDEIRGGERSVQNNPNTCALAALRTERRRLKGDKCDLLQQMRDVYTALEGKETELRDFLHQYETRMRETDQRIQDARKVHVMVDALQNEENVCRNVRTSIVNAIACNTHCAMPINASAA